MHGAGGLHAHFDGDIFDSPFTATLNQLLSEANDFTADSASHGLVDLDLSNMALPPLPGNDAAAGHGHHGHHGHHHHHHHHHGSVTSHFAATGALDFQAFLSTDAVMPSSPPVLRKMAAAVAAAGAGVGSGRSANTTASSAMAATSAIAAGKNGVNLDQLMLDSFENGDAASMWADLDHPGKDE